MMQISKTNSKRAIQEVVSLFLKLGITGFGGPAAHIAMMHDETVTRRKWLKDEEFLDLMGATNLIPGPNSTEMAIHLSYMRAGWRGLILGGVSFILPAVFIVIGLAYLYTKYDSYPQMGMLLYGIKPVIIAIVLQALWNLARKAIKYKLDLVLVIFVIFLFFLGVNEILLLLLGGIFIMAARNLKFFNSHPVGLFLLPFGLFKYLSVQFEKIDLSTLFFVFLKIGSILYGSGYVLLAFLRSDLVIRLGWLTDAQLLNAIAIGQVTPGPVFTTATFIGYILAGIPGAILATVGIFLPSFVLVAISNPFIPKMRNSRLLSGLLDGVNAVSIGLMAAVTWQLGRNALVDPITILLSALSLFLLIKTKINPTLLILGGGLIGFLSML
jgi:chromate transporter